MHPHVYERRIILVFVLSFEFLKRNSANNVNALPVMITTATLCWLN